MLSPKISTSVCQNIINDEIHYSPSNTNQVFDLVKMFNRVRNDIETTSASNVSLAPLLDPPPPTMAPHISSFPFALYFIYFMLLLLLLPIIIIIITAILHFFSTAPTIGIKKDFTDANTHMCTHKPLHPLLLLLWFFFLIYCASCFFNVIYFFVLFILLN